MACWRFFRLEAPVIQPPLATLIDTCSSECQLPINIFLAAPAFWLSEPPFDFELCLVPGSHYNDRNLLLRERCLQS
jgi:hypothetical protein